MIRKLLLLFFLSAITLAVYLFFYLGFYLPVELSVEDRGPLYLLYKSHTGAYHLIGPTIHEVEVWAVKQKVACDKTFGEYLDNPQSMDQDRLRSHGGCVLSVPLKKIPEGFQYDERAEKSYLVAKFNGSPAIGPFKVYPQAEKYLRDHRLKASEAVIETYLIRGSKVETDYLFSLESPPPSH